MTQGKTEGKWGSVCMQTLEFDMGRDCSLMLVRRLRRRREALVESHGIQRTKNWLWEMPSPEWRSCLVEVNKFTS